MYESKRLTIYIPHDQFTQGSPMDILKASRQNDYGRNDMLIFDCSTNYPEKPAYRLELNEEEIHRFEKLGRTMISLESDRLAEMETYLPGTKEWVPILGKIELQSIAKIPASLFSDVNSNIPPQPQLLNENDSDEKKEEIDDANNKAIGVALK
jgi:hypothetical protein